jgi:hypothetical protein
VTSLAGLAGELTLTRDSLRLFDSLLSDGLFDGGMHSSLLSSEFTLEFTLIRVI